MLGRVLAHFRANGKNPNSKRFVMTGGWALAAAMHLCPNGVDVFGFSHAGTLEVERGVKVPYHYYDANGIDSGRESLSDFSSSLSSLARQQPCCVRLHAPANLTDEEHTPPQGASGVDPLVDGFAHRFPRKVYAGYSKGMGTLLSPPVTSCPSLPPRPPGAPPPRPSP